MKIKVTTYQFNAVTEERTNVQTQYIFAELVPFYELLSLLGYQVFNIEEYTNYVYESFTKSVNGTKHIIDNVFFEYEKSI